MKTREDCLKEYGSDYFIQQKIEAGKLYRIEKGIYSETKYVPEVAVISFKYPNAVLTMRSAFYMYGLTDTIPDEYDLATNRDAAKISDGRVKQYFVPSELFAEGVEQIEYQGYSVRIYDKERMLVELVRYKTKLPYDYYKEILLNYRRILQQLNIQKIQDYALMAPKSGKILSILETEVF